MTSKPITSIEQFICLIHVAIKDPMYAEMYEMFAWGKGVERYWIYNLTTLTGEVECTLDYSLDNGGGWLCVSQSIGDFLSTIHQLYGLYPIEESVLNQLKRYEQDLIDEVNREKK
jgi:hypothetical protein